MYVCARYRTALSIVRDRQALQAEFLKSVIVGILIALIFFGPSDFMLIVKMYVCMRGNGIVYYDRSGSHNYPSLYERCAKCGGKDISTILITYIHTLIHSYIHIYTHTYISR